jgi:hypothetical protein
MKKGKRLEIEIEEDLDSLGKSYLPILSALKEIVLPVRLAIDSSGIRTKITYEISNESVFPPKVQLADVFNSYKINYHSIGAYDGKFDSEAPLYYIGR